MKLYLSSYRVPNTDALFKLFQKPPEELNGAIITNAKDQKPPLEKQEKLSSLKSYLGSIGLTKTTFVDLLADQASDNLEQYLGGYDYLFVMGGNNFDLRNAAAKSGFDRALPNLLNKGQVYIGESAGALIVGPSLRGFQTMDEAAADQKHWDGFGIIDTILVPHNDSSDLRYANRASHISAANPGCIVQPLNDNQALVVDGNNRLIVDGADNN